MKMTKQGKLPEEIIWKGSCTHCNCEFEAQQSELTSITHDQRDGSFSGEKCPYCHLNTLILYKVG